MKAKEQKEYEERVKHRVLILQQLLKDGQIQIPYNSDVEKSILACRYDSTGEPDLSTVDGIVRSLALMAEDIDYRKKSKAIISLTEIQKRYFSYIEDNFFFFYQKMIELNITPHQAAFRIAYGKHSTDHIQEKIELFVNDIVDFWELHSEPAYIHIEDNYNSIKAIFGGDLFPSYSENIASKCGIYVDTIILPCPFIRSKNLFHKWNKKEQVYYLIKHALNILQYKLLATAETDFPIVAILPDKEMLPKHDQELIMKLGNDDALFHANKIFKHKFKNLEELFDFASHLNTIDKVISEIEDEQRVLFNTDYKIPLKKQIEEEIKGQSGQLLKTRHPGKVVAALGLGRMNVCNELLVKSTKLGGIPLIDAPTSWEYFKWKMEYDAERTYPTKDYQSLHIGKGLTQLADTPLQWIGKIPPEGIIELHKNGALNEIRSIISEGINDIVQSDALNFTSTSNKVFSNLNAAFIQHQKNIKTLRNKKWKIAGKDIGSWLVMGSIEVASACIGTPIYGLSTVVLNQLFDAPKLKDLPKSIVKIKETDKERQLLKKSPIGLIFKYNK